MTDRELLDLAAKAAGVKHNPSLSAACRGERIWWNPLTDDGDALRLAVKLQIDVDNDHPECCVIPEPQVVEYYKNNNGDPYAATRRAIVRAAAEMGKSM